MSHAQLPISSLPVWSTLNDVTFFDTKIASVAGHGYGLVIEKGVVTLEETYDVPALVSVPHDLILNAEVVEQYAKEDRDFRLLFDAVGHQSARGNIILFLLVQLVLSSRSGEEAAGLSNPWTEYIKFLPSSVPLPSLWTTAERSTLRGTSLEPAVDAKLVALEQEFDRIREKSSDIPCWQAIFWENGTIQLSHWFLLDAWYRSRCLQLPKSGESMVPCIDMVNHSSTPNAYYEENSKDEVVLLVRPGCDIPMGGEITISYGHQKSAAEMLFSYGFIDTHSTQDSLVLPINPFPDDPLARAKLHIFGERPTVTLRRDEGHVHWESPFAYLMCVNEEDGLEFRVLQDLEGNQQLRAFWHDVDVSESARTFETLTDAHNLSPIYQLRAVIAIQERLRAQLERMRASALAEPSLAQHMGLIRDGCSKEASLLKRMETELLEEALENFEEQTSKLLADEKVAAYFGSMEAAQNELADAESSNEEEDFS